MKNNNPIVAFRLTKEEYLKLKELADKENRNISNYIRTKLFKKQL